MQKTIIKSENREWTMGFYWGLKHWMIGFNWWHSCDAVGNYNTNITVSVLCFTFYLEMWRWAK